MQCVQMQQNSDGRSCQASLCRISQRVAVSTTWSIACCAVEDTMLELKEAFGRYMGRYYASLTPTTRAMKSFAERGISKSIVWAPDRMIDQVQDMLAAWRKNDNDDGSGSSAYLPVMIVATGKDYSPVLGDFSRQVPEPEWVTLPGDPHNRIFKLRQMQGERRAQIVICAAEDETARSMAAQFTLFIAAVV